MILLYNLIPVIITLIVGSGLYFLLIQGARRKWEKIHEINYIDVLHHFDIHIDERLDKCLEKYLKSYVDTQGTNTREVLNRAIKYYLKEKY